MHGGAEGRLRAPPRKLVGEGVKRLRIDARRGRDQREGFAIDVETVLIGQGQRRPGRAVRQRREQGAVAFGQVGPRRGDDPRDIFGSKRRQGQFAAAAAQRRRNQTGDMRHQQQQRPRRGFFDDFQHRVRRIVVHLVGGVDHGDPPAALRGFQREEVAQRPRVVDDDAAAHPVGLAARVGGALDGGEVGMARRRNAAEDRTIGSHAEAAVARRLPRQHVTGEPIGQSRLADPARAGEQPGMVKRPAGEGARQGRFGRPVPEETRVGAGRGTGAGVSHRAAPQPRALRRRPLRPHCRRRR